MGLGIKEPRNFHGDVTGTIIMSLDNKKNEKTNWNKEGQSCDIEQTASHDRNPTASANSNFEDAISFTTTLKTTKDGIILHPQPHDNPNDPLNWPIWRRDLALVVLGFHCFVSGGQSSILASGLTSLADEFKISSSKASYLVGAFMLAMGFGSLFASPTSVLYGKRFVYLFGIIIFFAGAIWGAVAKTFGSLLGARILMGIGASPTESLPSATISEIYFAHERAYRLGLYTMLLLGGKNIVPLLASFVFQKLTRHWLFWIVAIIVGINFILTFFFVPETFWDRAPTPNKRSLEETERARIVHEQMVNEEIRSPPNSFAIQHQQPTKKLSSRRSLSSLETSLSSQDIQVQGILEPHTIVPSTSNSKFQLNDSKKRSFFSTLRIFSGRHTKDKWWMVFFRPFVLLIYPSVLFGAFLYTFAIVWLIMISETISHIFTAEPYNYSRIIVGLFYASPFVGGILGSLVAGRGSDIMVRFLVRRNNGVYEPELRLFMCLPIFVCIFIGMLGFGWASQKHDLWIVPVIFFGILGFGTSLASTTAISYTVDSYKMFAAEALVTLNVMKNVTGFLFSLFSNSFIARDGAKDAFLTFGCIELFVCLFSIPLYFYGKRLRRWTDKKEFMRFLYYVEKKPANEDETADAQFFDGNQAGN